MKKMILALPIFLSLALAGCGKLQQDPLAAKDESIRRARLPDEPDLAAKPLASDAVVIDSLLVWSFKELREDEYELKSWVNAPDYTVTLEIANLADFPGATYDETTSKFKWTPPRGLVVGSEFREMRLLVRSFAQPTRPGDPVLFRERQVTMLLAKEPTVPEILAIENPPLMMREGESSSFEIRFRDLDSGLGPNMMPDVEFVPAIASVNLANFAKLESITPLQAPGEFRARIRIDLVRAELTKTSLDGAMAIQIRSRLNRRSVAQTMNLKIFTRLSSMSTTWSALEEFAPQVERIHYFQILDPRMEGRISFMSAQNVPEGATLKCDTMGDSLLLCSYRWTPTAIQSDRNFDFTIQARLQNADPSDSSVQNQTFRYRVRTLPMPRPPGVDPRQPGPTEPIPVPEPNPGTLLTSLKGDAQ